MRTTTHHSRTNAAGRVHGNKHNDRNFDTSRADNIIPERSKDNIYRMWTAANTFAEAELMFYENTFGGQLAETNAKYIKNGHPERVKGMKEWAAQKMHCPEETVMQIGRAYDDKGKRIDEYVAADKLWECYEDYAARLDAWNDAHGNPFVTLDEALHVDEIGAPQIHTRRVWVYDERGQKRVGQEKALAAAGVELPEPDKKPSRHNNRKMTFDAMCRGIWFEVLREHGLEVEREPVPDVKHNRDKADVVREQYDVLIAETQALEEKAAQLRPDPVIDDIINRVQPAADGSVTLQPEDYTHLAAAAQVANAAAERADAADQRAQHAETACKVAETQRDLALEYPTMVANDLAADKIVAVKCAASAEIAAVKSENASLKEQLRTLRNKLLPLVVEAAALWHRFAEPFRAMFGRVAQSWEDMIIGFQSAEPSLADTMDILTPRWYDYAAKLEGQVCHNLDELMQKSDEFIDRETGEIDRKALDEALEDEELGER